MKTGEKMYTVEIFFTHFAIWVKISPLGGGAHKISVQKQVRTAARGVVLIFAKVQFLIIKKFGVATMFFNTLQLLKLFLKFFSQSYRHI